MTKIDPPSFGMIFTVLMCGIIVYGSWVNWRRRFVDQKPESWKWYDWFVLFVAGTSFGSFVFFGSLGTFLLPSTRPFVPDVAHGYTHLIHAKYGSVYGTYFEYWAVTFGPWIAWGAAIFGFKLLCFLKTNPKSRAFPLIIFTTAVISMGWLYMYWRFFDRV